MKTLLISFILLLSVIGLQSQTVMTVDPPSVTVEGSQTSVIKTAVAQIKARTTSTISIATTEYTIDYTDALYTVSVEYFSDVDNTQRKTEELFTSTRVSDVRIFMKEEIHIFYNNL